MLRTRAPSLYGWDILLKGTFWPGPIIGEKLGALIRSTCDAGHEVSLHAWDHYAWQTHINKMDAKAMGYCITRGVEMLTRILGHPPRCSAVPGWKCNDLVLMAKSKFPFDYNSDCRGQTIFHPIVQGSVLDQPQIPVTLPTYDEAIGRNGISDSNYNDYIFSLLEPAKFNVLTIHAEVEGIAEPINLAIECTKPFVEKVKYLQKERPGEIGFYQIGPNAEDIKFVASYDRPIKPVFVKNAEELQQQSAQTYFIARQKNFDDLPQHIAQGIKVQLYGKIGHRDCVVFSRKFDLDEPDL